MKAKQKVSVGIDGITCVVSGVFVLDEIHYPRESLKPILKITPKNKTTEIGIILPHTIRKDNNIGFRVSDTKMLADVVQAINRGLKSAIHRDWSELYVRSIEVACTVDMNCTDKCAVDSAVKFLCRCLLQEDRVNKEKTEQGIPNALRKKPIVKYATGERKEGCIFLKDEIVSSFETSVLSNKRLKWKGYSKGAFSEFGGETSIFRLEAVYTAQGLKHVLESKDREITLQDILKQKSIRKFIEQFKVDYKNLLCPCINGVLNESVQLTVNELEHTSVYDAFLISKEYMYDFRVFKKALKNFYAKKNKSIGSYRRMLYNVRKKIKEKDIHISEHMISIFEAISKAVK